MNIIDDSKIKNPILAKDLSIQIENDSVEINLMNVGKFFRKIYILCPFKNEPVKVDIFKSDVMKSSWNSLEFKMVLFESTIKLIKNKYHYENLCLASSENFKIFNHLGYDLDEEILIVPIFEVSFLNLIDYERLYCGYSNFKTVWNLVFLKEYFCRSSNLSYSSKIKLTEMIKMMEESNYWTLRYNCLCNISKKFNDRKFQLSYTKVLVDDKLKLLLDDLDKDDMENNYLTMIFNNKNFVDASSALKKFGYKMYRISKDSDLCYYQVNQLFDNLNYVQKYYFFCNMLISKNYSHFVINNSHILDKMKSDINYFIELFRYLISYSWIGFYFEECIKKTWIKKTDRFVFTAEVANKLPTFAVSSKDPKSNPYIPIMVDDSSLQSENNIGGVKFSYQRESETTRKPLNVIVTTQGFKDRFNVFMTGNMNFDIFNDINFNELGIGISGSVMAACLQENPSLMDLFVGKNSFKSDSSFDLDWSRYFSEYYSDADLDVMIKSNHPVDFIRKTKVIHNQLVVNVCGLCGYAEPDNIKYNVLRTIFVFIDEEFIRNNICSEKIKYETVVSNLKDEKIVNLIKPYFTKKISEFYDKMLENLSDEEIFNIKRDHPEVFELNKTVYEVHLKKGSRSTSNIKSFFDMDVDQVDKMLDDVADNSEDIELSINNINENTSGVNITFKVKIEAKPHITRVLELFPVICDDFFGVVSKFHLPCVRGFYDGDNVYLTPSCVTAHKTGWNIDYKYFAGSKTPIEIINKYRMRGFGTFLNKKEIDKLVKYSNGVPFWNNLYDINLTNKQSIQNCLGQLNKNHKLFHPRLYNADSFLNGDIDLVDPYNNIDIENLITDGVDNNDEMDFYRRYYPTSYHFDFLKKMTGINKLGYIEPLQKWVIESAFNIGKEGFKKDSLEKMEEEEISNDDGLGVPLFDESSGVIEYFSNSNADAQMEENV